VNLEHIIRGGSWYSFQPRAVSCCYRSAAIAPKRGTKKSSKGQTQADNRLGFRTCLLVRRVR